MAVVIKVIMLLAQAIEPLRFFKQSRERRAAEAAAAREHTIELIEAVLARAESASKANAEALVELGRGIQAQAQALQTWFELFKQSQDTEHLTTATVRPEDEWDEADQRNVRALVAAGFPIHGTAEEQKQWLEESL